MIIIFDKHGQEARKARFYVGMSSGVQTGLGLIASIAMLAGTIGVFYQTFIALMLWSFGVWVSLPLVWYRYGLRNTPRVPPDESALDLNKSLDYDILGRLQSADTAAAIWNGLRGSWQQRFFANRYGITADVFDANVNAIGDAQLVWVDAINLMRAHNRTVLSVGVILVALLRNMPNRDDLLAQAHLNLAELESSIDWLAHTENVKNRLGAHSQFGGLARDWTAGYTPTLNQLAHNISIEVEHGGFMYRDFTIHNNTVNEMVKFLGEIGRPNVVLVGDLGVGKTTIVQAFAQRLLRDPHVPGVIRYNQVFALDASVLVAQTNDGSGLENILLNVFAEAQKATNSIIFMDEAQLFFSEGVGAFDMSKLLQPIVENGIVPVILAMNPNDWQTISAQHPALAGSMNFLAIPEADEQTTMRIMEDQTLTLEGQHNVTYMYQALREAYRLADRYIHDMAFPGSGIRILESAVNQNVAGLITEQSIQASVEATHAVRVKQATEAEKQQLLNFEERIHRRMINQTRAVKVVADALRRARSGVTNPNKPMGTFLFLGPTGVGKTELAKSVADTYFGSENNIIRVDMNEFNQSADASRLLDPANQNGLFSLIRKQPFSVVLFDEIEKAHIDVVNVILQLLDEGIMRDSANKEASFRDAIVIATSNAGADVIREQIEQGKDVEQFEQGFVDGLIKSKLFNPEFINRFDDVVVFRPLNERELQQIVDLLVAEVNQTLARQNISVSLTNAAKEWIVKEGNDPRLGARPMRRMIQRTVENIVSKELLHESVSAGSTISIDTDAIKIELDNV